VKGATTNCSQTTPKPCLALSMGLQRLSVRFITNGQFQLTLFREAGRAYTIQASTNLVNWIAVTNFVSATGTNQFTEATAVNYNRRFYRAVTP